MPQFAVTAALILVNTALIVAENKDEVREILRDRFTHRDSGEWDLSKFEIDEANVQVLEVEVAGHGSGKESPSAAKTISAA